MIYLFVIMFSQSFGLLCVRLLLPVLAALPINNPRVDAPLAGDVLQGTVAIIGSTDISGFKSAEVLFAYDADRTGTWFLLHQSSEAVTNGTLANWDTTTITDGNYRLKVVVTLENGSTRETLVEGLRVRNYLPVETQAPVVEATQEPEPVPTLAAAALPVPTPLPANPAQVDVKHLKGSLLNGILFAAAGFVLLGVYLALSAFWRNS